MLNVKKTTALEKENGRKTRPPFLESLSLFLSLSLSISLWFYFLCKQEMERDRERRSSSCCVVGVFPSWGLISSGLGEMCLF